MHLGKYEVLDQIGVGGFGRVLLARDPEATDPAAQLVAVKRLRRAKAQRKGSLEAIVNEARIGSYLSHDNIVRVIELAQVGRDLLLVMEFINGIGLDELLSQRRFRGLALPPAVASQIAIQAGEGLHYAHSALSPEGEPLHIRHRDIKPSNIMICRKGVVKVMDFGVALTALPRVQTTTGTIKGTLRYLSPEQAQGTREIGPETDQFALALVLGEMLIGHPIYDAPHDHQILLKALRGQVATAIEEAERACPGIGPILTTALALKPAERYASTGDFVAAVRALEVPVGEGDSLAEWVHRGLEERAHLATDDALQPSGDMDPSAESGDIQVSVGQFSDSLPLGWVNEQLSAMEESAEQGWDLAPGQDPEAPILARTPGGPEGWAMVPGDEEELDWDALRRSPPSDEFIAAMFAPPAPRTLKKTDLSAEIQLMRERRPGKEAEPAPEVVVESQTPAEAAPKPPARPQSDDFLGPVREHAARAASGSRSAKIGATVENTGLPGQPPAEPDRIPASAGSRFEQGSASGPALSGTGIDPEAARAVGASTSQPAAPVADRSEGRSSSRGPVSGSRRERDRSGSREAGGRARFGERTRMPPIPGEESQIPEVLRREPGEPGRGGERYPLPFAPPEEPGAPSPTAYAVKRPGGDRVAARNRTGRSAAPGHARPDLAAPTQLEPPLPPMNPPPVGEAPPGIPIARPEQSPPATVSEKRRPDTSDRRLAAEITPVSPAEARTLKESEADDEGDRKGLRNLLRWLVGK